MISKHKVSANPSGPRSHRGQLLLLGSVLAAMATTGHAVTIPNTPLQTGTAYPAPNLMLVLDDSGSMGWNFMPDTVPSVTPLNIAALAYPRNTLSYNPNINYLPWMLADLTRITGGMTYTSAFSHGSLASNPIDLSNSARTFYVPKPGATNMANTASYFRYVIASGGGSIERSEYGPVVVDATNIAVAGLPVAGLAASSGGMGAAVEITIPAGVETLTVTSSGGTRSGNRGADLYLRLGSAPTTANFNCRSRNNDNNETCVIATPAAGTWFVALDRDSDYAGVTLNATYRTSNRCGTGTGVNDWINCTAATPTGRTVAAELGNYATWYSYHRTRMKVAKAGASEAFGQVSANTRVGYNSIWNRSPLPIPVGTNGGLFTGTNRTTWYARLQQATADGFTPLHTALARTGEYFRDTAATGPWGPEATGVQTSCRQNFAILTTDGYWNDTTGYTAVGDADGVAGPTHVPAATIPTPTYTGYVVQSPYRDNFDPIPATQANTLADVAMHYWKNDLRPDLVNDVPYSANVDPAFWQHMVTFGISIGLQGRLPSNALPAITNGTLRWGNPMDSADEDRIDDLWHAAVNGRGSFVAATDPAQFAQGLSNALAAVQQRQGSGSNVTANSTSFTTTTRVYQASYASEVWSGELRAFDASSAGVAAAPAWSASTLISSVGRNVLTWNGTAGATFPTTAQVAALDQSSRLLSSVNGTDNAAYIRGDRTREQPGGTLRRRSSLLGSIVNSSPMYVQETETIFVGANDGMLHAFNALTGAERFAYVPGGVNLGDLASLSDPLYSHRYFVDGPISVSTLRQTPGRHYLVGALGRGGKGVFGLDVTTPASFGASHVLWERTTGANMGMVLGEPLIATLNDSNNTVVAIFGNGINSSSGMAVLYVVNLATGALIQEINTNVGSDNGLSAPRGWDDNDDGTVDYVYAGDLKGNLWKFDFTGATASIAFSGTPMFTAASGQPITTGLALVKNPSTGTRWVFIGTGSLMTTADVGNTTVQSMYGVMDTGSTTITRADLIERQIVAVGTVGGRNVRAFEEHAPMPVNRKGWYIDLDNPTAGERIISRPAIHGTLLITASLTPPAAAGTCAAGGGGYVNVVDALTGTSVVAPYFDANGDGRFDNNDTLTVNGAIIPIGSIDLGVAMPTLPTVIDQLLVVGGSSGGLGSVSVNPQGGISRASWREIIRD